MKIFVEYLLKKFLRHLGPKFRSRERERESVCVMMRERGRERERECVCVCMCGGVHADLRRVPIEKVPSPSGPKVQVLHYFRYMP